MGKPQQFSIGGEELMFKPLTMKHIDLLMAAGNDNQEKQAKALAQIMRITLKEAVPDASEEEIEGVAINHFQELSDAIMEVNSLSNDRVKSPETSKKEE